MSTRVLLAGLGALVAFGCGIAALATGAGGPALPLAAGVGTGLVIAAALLKPTRPDRAPRVVQSPIEDDPPIGRADTRIHAEGALRQSEKRLAAQSAALTELTASGASGATSIDQRFRHILESCAQTLGVARVSIWQFEEQGDAIRCIDLFTEADGGHSGGALIHRLGHEAYFAALEGERVIAAEDARYDRRTSEFCVDYLSPLGIGAMLDVPLRRGDSTVGVLCLEHVGRSRAWTVDERNFALSVANLIAAATLEEDRRIAVQRLAESEERARLVIDTASDAFIGMDSDGKIVAWNAQSERTFGWSRQEAIGRILADTIIPEEYREAHTNGLIRFHQTGEAPVVNKRLELTALHRDGRTFPVELAITQPVRSGKVFFFGAFLRDISERLDRERELRQAKEAAEAAARVKSEFLANMSHELRTPLNGVLGYAQLLRRDRNLVPAHLEAVESIAACGEQLLNLINDVLDLSKIEAGRIEIETESIELQQLVTDMRLLIAESARKKGLQFEIEVGPGLPGRVMLDGRHLRQVLINLLSNAVKFTERGSVRLTMASEEPSRLRFEVADTGMGIPPEDQDVIFEAFRQTQRGAAAGGTGLGLTISRRLVRAMESELFVASEPGQGSRFWFSVPMVVHDRSRAELAEDSVDLRLAPGQEVTVLVVDDSTINRRIMSSLLESAGISVLRAAGGGEAVRIAAAQRPDLILMDLRMTDMDGFEATQKLRARASTAGIPVVAVTASPEGHNRERALAAGCNEFLAKPLRASDLYAALERLLSVRFEPIGARRENDGLPPPRVPEAAAERIRRAAQVGNLTELHQIAKELAAGDEPLARAGRHVSRLANAFEFESLERWASEGHD